MAVAFGVIAAVCASPVSSADTTEPAPPPALALDTGALAALIPTPPNSEPGGPDTILNGGIHMHFKANGAPNATLAAYKAALEQKGWDVTTIVSSTGDSGGGGTYTGTNGDAYGVFDGGGFNTTTYIDVCAWPTKPDEPNCTRGGR